MYTPKTPGTYYCRPFWQGKSQPLQLMKCYWKQCMIDPEVGPRTELVCDYGGYSHIVCQTGINKWGKNRLVLALLKLRDKILPIST